MQVDNRFEGVVFGFSTRHGGTSSAPFDTLNVAFHVGDDSKCVHQNRDIILGTLPNAVRIQAMSQVHGKEVCTVDSEAITPTADALITQQKGVALMVMVADCTPVLLYDKVTRTIAAVHAGRAGALENIVGHTLTSMHSQAKHIDAVLGPSIGACCYEVGYAHAKEAIDKGYDFAVQTRQNRYYLDINSILIYQLKAYGIALEHIHNQSVCTACHSEDYFSYRKEGSTGRFCGVIMLK